MKMCKFCNEMEIREFEELCLSCEEFLYIEDEPEEEWQESKPQWEMDEDGAYREYKTDQFGDMVYTGKVFIG